ncbi:MAG: GNAT family N-acetyltransferase [Chloroflexi bacterium]|nr:GNAT family N-acetyltransferase [Chloroflexota bacterium]
MTIRTAQISDRHLLAQLWQTAGYVHVHAEWQLPVDWLGEPGFVVWDESTTRPLTFPPREEMILRACLALIADPLPSAWVRIAAAHDPTTLIDSFQPLLAAVWPTLIEQGVTEVGWLVMEPPTQLLLPHLGFGPMTELETYVKRDLHTAEPPSNERVTLRALRQSDIERVTELDAAAYAPLWRYSAQALTLARPQALTFTVALLEDQIVGYLFSTASDEPGGAHLVRLTVSPQMQGQGVGRTLLNQFIRECRLRGLDHISLNTQTDNLPSQKLYRQYGFRSLPSRIAVWNRPVDHKPV